MLITSAAWHFIRASHYSLIPSGQGVRYRCAEQKSPSHSAEELSCGFRDSTQYSLTPRPDRQGGDVERNKHTNPKRIKVEIMGYQK